MYKPKPIHRFESELVEVKDLTYNDKEFIFTVPEDFEFICGQFVSFLFEIEGKPLRRPYSICSSPYELGEKNVISYAITKVENGPGTTKLWNLTLGDKVNMMGPMGVFVLKDEFTENGMTFIGTGTGIAPFRSMIKELLNAGYEKPIRLFAGCRYLKTRLYHDEFVALSQKYPHFEYHSAVSQAETDHEHTTGRVTKLVEEFITKTDEGHFFMCGLYPMIKEVGSQLSGLGIPKERIHFERYD